MNREFNAASVVKFNVLLICVAFFTGGYFGYKFPRDVEIESTKPVVFSYEINKDAANYLILKDVKSCGESY